MIIQRRQVNTFIHSEGNCNKAGFSHSDCIMQCCVTGTWCNSRGSILQYWRGRCVHSLSDVYTQWRSSLMWPRSFAWRIVGGAKGRGGRKKGLVTLNRMLLALLQCWQVQSESGVNMVCKWSHDFRVKRMTRLTIVYTVRIFMKVFMLCCAICCFRQVNSSASLWGRRWVLFLAHRHGNVHVHSCYGFTCKMV